MNLIKPCVWISWNFSDFEYGLVPKNFHVPSALVNGPFPWRQQRERRKLPDACPSLPTSSSLRYTRHQIHLFICCLSKNNMPGDLIKQFSWLDSACILFLRVLHTRLNHLRTYQVSLIIRAAARSLGSLPPTPCSFAFCVFFPSLLFSFSPVLDVSFYHIS